VTVTNLPVLVEKFAARTVVSLVRSKNLNAFALELATIQISLALIIVYGVAAYQANARKLIWQVVPAQLYLLVQSVPSITFINIFTSTFSLLSFCVCIFLAK